ncbi:MAG: prolyl oligopeptidase family serine peptidase [Pirellulaceae bacterium]|nr:prolyl oligopeptidase family serine peptidase [Pirellulaceae bacterium]
MIRGACLLATMVATLSLEPATLAEETLLRTPEKFDLNGHMAILYAAPKPAEGKPWVWYFPTIKGLSLAGKRVYFEGILNAGISLAGYDLGEVRGAPASTEKFTKFYDEMVRRGWSDQPILLGQSRGGLMALAWGIRHPEKTRAFVGIYPVCNLETWGLKNMEVALADYKIPEAELRTKVDQFNPVHNLQNLIEKKVPMFMIHGDMDKAVPYEQNTLLVKQRYVAGGAPITVKRIAGLGHEAVPEFFENQELLALVLQQAGVPAK